MQALGSTHLKNDAVKNSKEWMNKAKMSAEVVEALMDSYVKVSKG